MVHGTHGYSGPEGHSLIDGSHVRTLMIDQSMVDSWTFV